MARAKKPEPSFSDEQINALVENALEQIRQGVASLNDLRREGLIEWDEFNFAVTVKRAEPKP